MDVAYTCTNPDCEAVTTVRHIPATRDEPGYPDTDCCRECGAELDWESEVDPPEPDWDRMAEIELERAREATR